MNEQQMTVKDVIRMVAGQLEGIQVPVSVLGSMPQGFAEKLGREISTAIQNLNACVNAIERTEAQAAEKSAEAEAAPEAEESEVPEDE